MKQGMGMEDIKVEVERWGMKRLFRTDGHIDWH
jgi:hypothetical protein